MRKWQTERHCWPRVRPAFQSDQEPEHTTLFFSSPFPTLEENLKSYWQGLSLTGCVLCLLSFHCVLFPSGLHFIGVIEPQPLSVRDGQPTLSQQAGKPAPRDAGAPLSSAFSVPRPTQLKGRPFCNERRWVNTAPARKIGSDLIEDVCRLSGLLGPQALTTVQTDLEH